jgi:hypothetical protein
MTTLGKSSLQEVKKSVLEVIDSSNFLRGTDRDDDEVEVEVEVEVVQRRRY